MYWHLSQTFIHPEKRRVLQCPRCQGTMPAWSSVNFHKHGRTNVAVVPKVLGSILEEYVKPESMTQWHGSMRTGSVSLSFLTIYWCRRRDAL